MYERMHVKQVSDTKWEIRIGDETVGKCEAVDGWNTAEGDWWYRGEKGTAKGNVGHVIEQLMNAIHIELMNAIHIERRKRPIPGKAKLTGRTPV